MTDETAGHFIRRFLDTYEEHDLDTLWTFYSPDCRFPVLERFDIEPSWENYKVFMETFIDAFPDVHHTIEKLMTDGDSIWAAVHHDRHPSWPCARCPAHRETGSLPARGDVPGRGRTHHRSRPRVRWSPHDAPNRRGA